MNVPHKFAGRSGVIPASELDANFSALAARKADDDLSNVADAVLIERGISTGTTTFNTNGSITKTENGVTVTTTFNANGSITTDWSAPVSRSVTTTFNADGTITEA